LRTIAPNWNGSFTLKAVILKDSVSLGFEDISRRVFRNERVASSIISYKTFPLVIVHCAAEMSEQKDDLHKMHMLSYFYLIFVPYTFSPECDRRHFLQFNTQSL
jgi:hypothetical protein